MKPSSFCALVVVVVALVAASEKMQGGGLDDLVVEMKEKLTVASGDDIKGVEMTVGADKFRVIPVDLVKMEEWEKTTAADRDAASEETTTPEPEPDSEENMDDAGTPEQVGMQVLKLLQMVRLKMNTVNLFIAFPAQSKKIPTTKAELYAMCKDMLHKLRACQAQLKMKPACMKKCPEEADTASVEEPEASTGGSTTVVQDVSENNAGMEDISVVVTGSTEDNATTTATAENEVLTAAEDPVPTEKDVHDGKDATAAAPGNPEEDPGNKEADDNKRIRVYRRGHLARARVPEDLRAED